MKLFRTLLTAAVVMAAMPAAAQTFNVRGGTGLEGCSGATSFDETASSPLTRSGNCNRGFGATSGTSRADFGSLGISAVGSSSNSIQDSRFVTWSSDARYEDQLMFTSTDPFATEARVSAYIDLDGLLDVRDGGLATVGGGLTLNGVRSTFNLSPGATTPQSLSRFSVESGTFAAVYGMPVNVRLRTFELVVPLNQLVGFSLDIGNRVAVSGPDAFANSAFLNSFKVPLGADAFALADGVTVNSGSWLVNNRRIDPNAAVVPEPATWAIMICGFGLAGAALRRRRLAA